MAAKKTSFRVTCPMCGDADGIVRIDLNNLAACSCSSCDEEFSPAAAVAKLEEQLSRWRKVSAWVELAGGISSDQPAADSLEFRPAV